jgi:hypothetical protein
MTLRASLAAVSGTAALLVVLAGCGGSSAPPAGHDLAAQACQSGGSQAATFASQAASANPVYATLSADESARAATESGEVAEQSDPSGVDNSGLGSLATEEDLGSAGSIKVLTDCTKLGLSIVAKH